MKQIFLWTKTLGLIAFLFINVFDAQSQCSSTPGTPNGGIDGNGFPAPTDWTDVSTNSTGQSHAWDPVISFPVIGPSPQGGMVLGINSYNGYVGRYTDGAMQTTLTDLCQGVSYEICWYDAVEPNYQDAVNTSAGYTVSVAGSTSTYVAIGSWDQDCKTFVAGSSTETVVFTLPQYGYKDKMVMDGLTISFAPSPCTTSGSTPNGGIDGEGFPEPTAWTDVSTNSTGQSHAWDPVIAFPIIGPSPQGGMVLGLSSYNGLYGRFTNAAMQTTLNDLCIGNTYEICWYDAVEPFYQEAVNSTANYTVSVTGSTSSYFANGSWGQDCKTFVAGSSTETVVFTLPQGGSKDKMVIDGLDISLVSTNNTPPTITNILSGGTTLSCGQDKPSASSIWSATDGCQAYIPINDGMVSEVVSTDACGLTTYTCTITVLGACGNTATDVVVFTSQDNTNPTASNPSTISVDCWDAVSNPDPNVVTDEADNCSSGSNLTVTFINDMMSTSSCTSTSSTPNGGIDGNGFPAPTGWTDVSTNSTGQSHAWNPLVSFPVIGPSPQGGMVLGINSYNGYVGRFTNGAMQTTLNGLCSGSTYEICWYDAVEPYYQDAVNTSANYTVSVAGSTSSYSAIGSWGQDCMTFVASSSSHTVVFTLPQSGYKDKMVMDGLDISLVSSNNTGNIVTNVSCNDYANGGFSIIRTYRVEDCSGNTRDVTQTINVNDTTDPTGSTPSPISVACWDAVPGPDPSVITDEADDCSNASDLSVYFVSDSKTSVSCNDYANGGFSFERHYRIEDCAGNTRDIYQSINVNDTTAPTASDPSPITVSCWEDVPSQNPSVVTNLSDDCSATGDLSIIHVSDSRTSITCADYGSGGFTFTRTYRVEDCAGNSTTVTQTINVNDTTNPTASNPPAINVECWENVPAPNPSVVSDEADNCDSPGQLTVAHVSDSKTSVTCGDYASGGFTFTRTYSITDCAGNSTTVTQTINVNDTTSPTASNPAPITAQCYDEIPAADINLINDESDNCDAPNQLTVVHVGDSNASPTCADYANGGFTITRTYRITDCAGNSTEVTQTIVIDDTTAPSASDLAPVSVQCWENIPSPDPSLVATEADNCASSGDLTVVHLNDSKTSATCNDYASGGFSFTRTYEVEDCAGNTAVVSQTINVNDTTNPTASNPSPVTVQCWEDVPAVDVSVVTDEADNCDSPNTLTVTHEGDSKTSAICNDYAGGGFTFTRTYRVTDCAGNFIEVTQTINVNDTTNPTASNPATINVECWEDVANADVSVVDDESDNCDAPNQLTVTHQGDSKTSATCNDYGSGGFTVIRTYRVTDCAGNFTEVTQTINVNDTTNPTATNPSTVTVECWEDVPAVDINIVNDEADNCDAPNALTVTHEGDSKTSATCSDYANGGFTIIRTYRVTDCAGNFTEVTQTINVDDTTPPAGSNPAPVTVQCWEDVPAVDVAVVGGESDNCAAPNEVTVTHISDSKTSATCADYANGGFTFTRIYRLTDCAGNTTDVEQTITVDDTTNPTASNPSPVTVECWEDVPAVDIAVVTDEADNCDSPNTLTVTHEGDSKTSAICNDYAGGGFTITRTYRVTDCAGNFTEVTQTIDVDDTTNPTASNPSPVTVECWEDVPAPDVTVVTDEADNCDSPNALTVTHEGDDKTTAACGDYSNGGFTITRTYRVTDCAGNFTEVTQTINIEDTTAPTASDPAPISVQCWEEVPAVDVTVVTDEADNCQVPNELTVTHVSDSKTSATCADYANGGFTFTRTYRVTDCAGNTTDVTQTISVDDTTPPAGSNPATITVECWEDIPAVDITVVGDEADNCASPNEVTVEHLGDSKTTALCGDYANGGFTFTRTYRLTDCAGNTTDVEQTIIVDDTTAPTASNPTAVTVQCWEDVPAVDITVVTDEADNCDSPNTLTVTHEGDSKTSAICNDYAGGGFTITRTYRITDCAGNFTEVTQTIDVDDTTAPTASNPTAVTVQCWEDVPAVDVTVVTDEADNCAAPNDVTVEHLSDSQTAADCADYINGGFVITRIYTVTDCAGNVTEVTQTITIEDTTAPTASDPAPVTVECWEDVPAPDVTVVTDEADNCQVPNELTVEHMGDSKTSAICDDYTNGGFSFTRTYRVTDCAGNTTEVTQTINVDDTTPPAGSTPAPLTVQCWEDVPAPDVTIIADEADNCAAPNEVTVEHIGDTMDAATCNDYANGGFTITRTYRMTDCAGNSTEVEQIININDVTAPLASAPAPITIACFEDLPAADIEAVTDESDNCAAPNELTVIHLGDDMTAFDCADYANGGASIIRSYQIADCAGNSTVVDQIITIRDEIAPTASNPGPITIECFEDMPTPNPELVTDEADNCSQAPTVEFLQDDITALTCDGGPEDITRTYRVTDCAGNTVDVVQIITVEDITDPIILGVEADGEYGCTEEPIFSEPTVEDNCLGTPELTYEDVVTGTPETGIVTTRTWTATDCAGNTAEASQSMLQLPCMSIGSTVFYDDNNNGQQDAGELSLGEKAAGKSVTLELYDAATDALLATTTTDANGSYIFRDLDPGDYYISFMPPASASVSSTPTSTADDQVDGDDNGIQADSNGDGLTDGVITSPVINLAGGAEPTNEPSTNGGKDSDIDANGDMTIDFGLVRLTSVGSTVFSDNNNNGLQDAGELTLGEKGKTITLELYDANTGGLVATTTTDANGSYVFDNLLPGDYYIEFTPPASASVSSGPTSTTDDGVDGDDNGTQADTNGDGLTDGVITSNTFNLEFGDEPTNEPGSNGDKDAGNDEGGDMTIDFGLVPLVSLGSTVFYDDNNNGQQDAGELALGEKAAGKTVTLELYDAATDQLVATTTTDANGSYLFSNLMPGDYYVAFTPPASASVSSTPTSSADDQVDGDDNGIQTDSNGDGLTDGQITSPVISLEAGSEPTNEPGSNGNKDAGDDASGDMTVDFGLVRLTSVGSTVFSDDNNNGQQDPGELTIGEKGKTITLELYDATTDQLVATTTTDSNGSYVFDNLLPGDYYIEFMPPASQPVSSGPTSTTDDGVDGDDNGTQNDSNGDGVTDGVITSPDFNLEYGTEPTNEPGSNGDKDAGNDEGGDMTIDFGLISCQEISGEVFVDANADGCNDPAEAAVPNVTVELFECDANGNPIAGGSAVGTTTTDADGQYLFDDTNAECLVPGNEYYVVFDIPAGHRMADQDVCGDPDDSDADATGTTSCIDPLDPNSDNIDGGIVPLMSVGSTVFHDENNNGIQDAGEPSVGDKGKTISLDLFDAAGNFVATTTTDANGSYIFQNLDPGDYYIEFTPPVSLPVSSTPTNTADDNVDSDDNGAQTDSNGDGVTDGVITSPVFSLDPYQEPVGEAGTNGDKDAGNDDNGDMTIDFGLISCQEISGEVFVDENADGCKDPAEAAVPNVSVELFECDAAGNPVAGGSAIGTTTTDANGQYTFDDTNSECLTPGNEYYVVFDIPTGHRMADQDVCGDPDDSDADDTGATSCIDPSDPNSDNVDGGIVPLMSVGSTVFHDENNNGIQDAGEPSVGDKGKTITIDLYDAAGNFVATTTTDANGSYIFQNLDPGDYYIEFTPPASLPVSSTPTNTADDNVDSDDNGAQTDSNGDGVTDGVITSPVFSLDPYQEPVGEAGTNGDKDAGNDDNGDMTIDFGLISCQEISGEVFVDENADGCKDPAEAAVPNVSVELFECDAAGNPVAGGSAVGTTTTDADGQYTFDETNSTCLVPGNLYSVVFDIPAGHRMADQDVCGDPDDSDADDTGATSCIDPSDPNSDNVDGGIVPLMSVGSTVFHDENNNGIQDAGEPSVGDKGKTITIDLYDAAGNFVATTTTDANGSYIFQNLDPGDYYIEFTPPASLPVSSTPTNTADDNVDSDDNGTQTDSNGDGVTDGVITSPVFSLDPYQEPVGEAGTNGDKDAGNDDNGDMTIDFGLISCQEISGEVFVDENLDGCKDPSEAPVPNVNVELFECDANGNPVAGGSAVGTTTTDGTGQYTFDQTNSECLVPGTQYFVVFDIPAGNIATAQGVCGGPDDSDADDTGTTSCIDPSDPDLDNVNVGIIPLMSVGSTVFSDNNNNGIQDAGELTLGEKGKTVTLDLYDAAGNLVATTTTDANGSYIFNDLVPGDYYIEFTPPVSSPVSSTTTNTADDQTDGDDNGIQADTNGDGLTDGPITSPVFTLMPGTEPTSEPGSNGGKDLGNDENGDMTIDFGLVSLGSIGSTVFSDDNNNGLLDPGEETVGDKGKTITLDLIDANTGALVAQTTTDASGSYIFTNLLPGDYIVQFIPPASLAVSSTTTVSADNQTDGDDNGSQQDTDGDGITDGLVSSPTINITPGSEPTNESGIHGDKDAGEDANGDMTIDFGLVPCQMTCLVEGVDTECGFDNGSVVVTAAGGNGPISFLWSNGETTASIIDLAAGTYTITVTDELGCTSECSVDIAPSASSVDITTEAFICLGETYTHFGDDYTIGGTYSSTQVDANGCDYEEILILTVYPQSPDVVTVEAICLGETFAFQGNTYDASGEYIVVLQDANGCDYNEVLQLTVYPQTPDVVTFESICPGVAFAFLGNTYDTAGEFVVVLQDANGCDYNEVLQLTVYPQSPDVVTVEAICPGVAFAFQGNTYDTAGEFTVVQQDANGCDYNEVLQLTVYPQSPDVVTVEAICSGETFAFQGNTYDTAGEFTVVQQDANGCDYNEVLQLTVYPQSPDVVTVEAICSGETFAFQGNTYDTSGDFIVVLQDANGCDYNEVLQLTVYPQSPDVVTVEAICPDVAFAFQGNTYDTAGEFVVVRQDANGCDYNEVLQLTVYPQTDDLITEAAICPGETYEFQGTTYNSTDVYTTVVQDANGCDYNEVLDLTVYPQTPDNITQQQICSGESFDFFGQVYSIEGSYTVVVTDANGCDYNEILELGVTLKPQTIIINQEICSGETYSWNGETYGTSGTYIQENDGCTADQRLNLVVVPKPDLVIVNEEICSGETFSWNGQTYSASGTYTATNDGCIADEQLNLTVTAKPQAIVVNEEICSGETFSWNGQTYSASGTYTATNDGCTADEQLNLVVTAKPQVIVINEEICSGETFSWNGQTYSASGTYTATNDGCTADEQLNLVVAAKPQVIVVNEEICSGETFSWNGQTYSASGTYTATNDGCSADEQLNLTVTVKPQIIVVYETICSGEIFSWNGQTYSDSGLYTVTNDGCTADEQLNLVVTAKPQAIVVNEEICSGETFSWNGQTYSASGTYTATNDGCTADEQLNLTVTVKPQAIVVNEEICSGETFSWNGQTYSASGTYTATNDGCTADEQLNLTVTVKPQTIVVNEEICSGETFSWNGQTYSASGTYDVTNDGCTADEQLNLVVTPKPQAIVVNEEICSGETFSWNGQTYSASGTYDVANAGCTADEQLNLVVTPKPQAIVTNETICSGETFSWNGQTYSASGTYSASNDGCTADEQLNLVVTPKPQAIVTNETICSGETFSWNGETYSASGTYDVTNAGCTADEQLNLVVTPKPQAIVTNETICSGETFSWNGQTYSASGTYDVTNAGCTADEQLNLVVTPKPQAIVTNETICSGETFSWNGQTYSASGTYDVTNAGCTADEQLNLVVTPKPQAIVTNETICSGETFSWNGQTYSASGTYDVTNAGCTADEQLNLVVTPKPQAIVTNETICSGETFSWNGETYSASGTYTATNAGCVADEQLNLVVTPKPQTIVANGSICEGESYEWNGQTYSASGTYDVANDGCTADQQLILAVTPKPQTIVVNETICEGETFSWNGETYSTAGTYTQTNAGCIADEQLTLVVTAKPADQVETATICEGESYLWNGQSYAAAGTYEIPGALCAADQVLNLTVTSKPADQVSTETICEGESFSWNGQTYSAAGTYELAGTNCSADQILNLSVTPKPADQITTETICEGESFSWNGQSYTAAGTYEVAGALCAADQILNLTVTSKPSDQITNESICEGESFSWNGQSYTAAGTYEVAGALCAADQILNLSVTAKPADQTTSETICEGESYIWNGQSYTASGTYEVAGALCAADQILILNVTPKPSNDITDAAICEGESYTWNGQSYSQAGTYNLAGALCAADQILNLTVTTKPVAIVENASICEGESYAWNGQSYSLAGTYNLPGAACEANQVLILAVTAKPAADITNASICSGSTYTWNGQNYNQAGNYTIPGAACAADQELYLIINTVTPDVMINASVCEGGTYFWTISGETYSEAGIYTQAGTDLNGCDFNSILVLTVTPSSQDVITNASICSGEVYSWNGTNYGQAGSYTVAGVGDCSGDQVLNLSVLPGTDDLITDAQICIGEMYPFGGQMFDTAGSYTLPQQDSNGCSYDAILNLTVVDCGTLCDDFLCFYYPGTLACNGTGGSATLVVQGGTPPYSYAWSDGQTTETAVNLAAGIYGTTITDSNGCVSGSEVTVEADPACEASSITIQKLTNGIDDDNQMEPVIIIAPGSSPVVEWTYIVTNNGSTILNNIQVTDDQEGFICSIATLAPGQSQTCTHEGNANLGKYQNIGTATGESPGGSTVTAQDTSSYIGAYINVEKTANKSCVCPGEEVDFTLSVRLLGGAEGIQIGNITVADSHLAGDLDISSPEFVQSSDQNGNGFIDFIDVDGDGKSDEEFIFRYTLTVDETITNTATDIGEVFYQGLSIGMANNESSVTITASDACCAGTGECDMTFKPTSTTEATCGVSNGTINISVIDGLAPYSYIWSNGETTEDLNGLSGGAYTVTVSDATGCTISESVVVSAEGCGQVGNTVWEDLDADGMQDANEPGIEGVVIQLVDAITGEVVATTTTAADGSFLFTNVGAGTYYIEIGEMPTDYQGHIPTITNAGVGGMDNDISGANGNLTTDTFTLEDAEINMTFDLGFYEGNEIGNQVWIESIDGDNKFDENIDQPAENVIVNLYMASNDSLLQTVYTDMYGRYLFQDVCVGEFYVEFIAPANMTFVDLDAVLGDDVNDSDAKVDPTDPQIGRSHIITLTTGESDYTIDAGLVSQNSVLAIEMLALSARHNSASRMNVVEWTTARELNSDFFSIERSIGSTDNFEEIGTENASGNTISDTEYFYNDRDLVEGGTYYYRLNMVDLDGSSAYSNVVSVEVEVDRSANQKITLDVYPNPVMNQINIDLVTEFDSKIDGGIYDAIGQLIKKLDNDNVTAGKTSMRMDVSELPSGTYLFRLQLGKQVIFEKITKAE